VRNQQRFLTEHRLLNSHEFDQVFKQNLYRVSGPEFLLLAKPNLLPHNRLGLVIGKKITAHAVDRNKIKRQIRESFRTKLPRSLSIDLVIVTRPGVRNKSKAEISAIFDKIWQKLERKMKVMPE